MIDDCKSKRDEANCVFNQQSSILIKTPPVLSPQPSRVHHLDQQRTWPVLGITEPIEHDAHDVEANVEADKVGERERAHGMRHAQLEHFVDRLRRWPRPPSPHTWLR